MAFSLPIDIHKEFTVRSSYGKVFGVLADVPESVSHFPKVEKLENMGGNKWLTVSEKVGVSKYAIQTSYACDYTSNEEEGWVRWVPVPGVGNAEVSGSWNVKDLGDGTVRVTLDTRAVREVPLPKLTKGLVGPLAVREFESMVNQYVDNLKRTFES